MKKNVLLNIIFITIVAISTNAYSQFADNNNSNKICNQEMDSILKVASIGIHSFIDNIPETNLDEYGFTNKEEFSKITFDKPLKIYILKDNNLSFISTWRVPVMIDGEYRALLTVVKENNEFKAVDFGARVLAKEVFSKKSSQTIGLLRVYELKKDFIIEEISKGVFKFNSVKDAEEKQYDLDEIINLIKNK